MMWLKITFLSFLICFANLLFSQAPLPPSNNSSGNTKGSNPGVFNGNQTIATSYTRTACGLNYVYCAKPLFARTGNNFTSSVAQPATFPIAGIPPCAVIDKAFLYSGSSGTNVPVNVSITNPLTGNLVFSLTPIGTGPDKNWGFAGSQTYRGDVTNIISGNGNYVISGLPTSSVNTGDDTNGALLLIIYTDRSQNYTGSIVLADGNFVNANATGSVNTTITGFDVCGNPSLTTNFMLIDDLQAYDTTLVFLNSATPNYTQLPTADLPWLFLTDPGNPVTTLQTSADFGLVNTADTVGLLMAGFYFQSDCLVCPETLNLVANSTPACLATATVAITNGIAPFTYTWSSGVPTGSTVTGLSAGVLTVTASDNLGCITGSTTVNVLTPAPPMIVNSATVCPGVSANLAAGIAVSYTWSPPGDLNLTFVQNVIATPLATTIYTVDFIDALGCTGSATCEVLINLNPATPIAVNNATVCPGVSANLNAGAATAYTWSPSGTLNTANLQNVIATPLATTIYTINFIDISGCAGTSTCEVLINLTPATPIAVNNATVCPGVSANLNAGAATAYTWSPPGTLNASNVQNVIATPLATTIYTINFIDISGCAGTSTCEVLLNLTPATPIAVNNATVCPGVSANLNAGAAISYTWSPAGTVNAPNSQNVVVTPVSTTIYTINFMDIAGCAGTSTCEVLVSLTPATPIAVNNATICIGETANLNAGVASSYTWSPSGTLNSANIPSVIASPLATTIYTISFVDAGGCSGTSTSQVLVQTTQTFALNNNTLCAAQTIPLVNIGPVGDFYRWQGPNGYISFSQNNFLSNASTIMSGAYNLSVTTVLGCTRTAVSQVTVFALPNTSLNSNAPICSGFNLNLAGNGGLNYSWTGPNGFISLLQNPVILAATPAASGIYFVTATFANGCAFTATRSIAVNAPPIPTVAATGTNVCIGRPATFSLTLPYNSVLWAGPNGFTSVQQVTTIIINLISGGVYTVTVTDGNGCVAATTKTVLALVNPTVSIASPTVCLGGLATFTAVGLGFYDWRGPNGFIVTGNLTPTVIVNPVSLASAGNYTCTLTSLNSTCTASATTNFTIEPLPIPVSTSTDVCLNSAATLTVSGATTYTWTGPNNYTATGIHANIPAANPLTTGIYTALVTGPNTCTEVITATLGTVPLPTVSATGTLLCLNEPFTIVAQGAQTYTWTGPSSYYATGTGAYVPVVNNLSIGTYTVFGVAPNTCTGIATTTLATMPLPVITTTSAAVCINQPAVLIAGGGLPNTTGYTWTGPGGYLSYAKDATIAIANNPLVQTYTVVGTALNTCTNVATANLTTLPLPNVTATGSTVCYGHPFTLVAYGASTYTWSGPNSVNTSGSAANLIPVVNALSTGIYTVRGRSAAGCINVATVGLNSMPLPVITASGTTVCFLDPATIMAGGGVPNGYYWTGPAGYTFAAQNANIPVANSLNPQYFTVVGTGLNTCTNTATAILKTYPLPKPAYNATTTVCIGSYVSIDAFGAKTYSWTGPRHFSSQNKYVSFPAFNVLQSGTYTLNVTDSLGCKGSTTAIVDIHEPPNGFLISNNPGNYCVPYCSSFRFTKITPSPIIATHWSYYGKSVDGEVFDYCPTQAGTVALSGKFIDNLGCTNTLTFDIISNPVPVADFVVSSERPTETIDLVEFTNYSSGDYITNYNWSFIETSQYISSEKNITYLFENAGQYEVELTVVNKWGCKDATVKFINVETDVKLYVPDAFSPNNDGINETFQPKGRGIVKYLLEVYNRWGDKIFHSEDFMVGWDGKINGNICENDSYPWKIFATDIKGKKHDLSGHVTLLH